MKFEVELYGGISPDGVDKEHYMRYVSSISTDSANGLKERGQLQIGADAVVEELDGKIIVSMPVANVGTELVNDRELYLKLRSMSPVPFVEQMRDGISRSTETVYVEVDQ
jgi:hypothetical protein